MEIGCPAVDKGANQPNVFVDPKSSENALPYFSRGVRDDLMQGRFLNAFRDAFDWTKSGYVSGLNPISSLTGERMVSLDHIFVYCWDARPYPAFPYEATYWGDGDNWALGHWINGRLGSASLDELVRRLLKDYGFDAFDAGKLVGTVPGYVIDRVMSAREALQPLELAYFFDSVESGGKIAFRHRGQGAEAAALTIDDLVEDRAGEALYELTRGQETELPASAKVRYISGEENYQQAVAEARRLTGASGRVAQADLPIVLDGGMAGAMAETWLYETWSARERASFKLPPSALALEPGDTIALNGGGRIRALRVTGIADHGVREIEARSIDVNVYDFVDAPSRTPTPAPPVQVGSPAIVFADLPVWMAGGVAESGYVAALQKPWPGSVAVYASPQSAGYQLKALVPASATMGVTLDDLPPGPEGRIDKRGRMRVRLTQGTLASADLVSMLGGANTAAVRNANDEWEILQFLQATLSDVQTYELSGFLRGQFGTEDVMSAMLPAGSAFVLLDAAVTRIPLSADELLLPLNWRCGPGNRDIGDASYVTSPFTFRGLGRRPFSPAHVRGVRAGGDISISWLRRTRAGGDSWEVSEVPLGEESETYEVEILSGAMVKRTISSTAPTIVYSSAQQTADFGSPQSSLSVRVYQTNTLFGRSPPRAAII